MEIHTNTHTHTHTHTHKLFNPLKKINSVQPGQHGKTLSLLKVQTLGDDPRWPIANISGLQLPVKAQRTRGHHTFRQILVAHGAEDSQWRSHTGRQRDSCGRRSGFCRHLGAAALGAE